MKDRIGKIAYVSRFVFPLIVLALGIFGLTGAINVGHKFWLILLVILSAVGLMLSFESLINAE